MARRRLLERAALVARLAAQDVEPAGNDDGGPDHHRLRRQIAPDEVAEADRPDDPGIGEGGDDGGRSVAKGLRHPILCEPAAEPDADEGRGVGPAGTAPGEEEAEPGEAGG